MNKRRKTYTSWEKVSILRRAYDRRLNGLEVCELDRCPDHGIDGFKRYVALAVLSRNIQRLGAIIRKRDIRSQMLRAKRKKTA